jgi:hypothetical protein
MYGFEERSSQALVLSNRTYTKVAFTPGNRVTQPLWIDFVPISIIPDACIRLKILGDAQKYVETFLDGTEYLFIDPDAVRKADYEIFSEVFLAIPGDASVIVEAEAAGVAEGGLTIGGDVAKQIQLFGDAAMTLEIGIEAEKFVNVMPFAEANLAIDVEADFSTDIEACDD